MSAKQDRTRPRTATDIERKYCFGKTFGELLGLAQAAQDAAKDAQRQLDGMDAEEIFKILTGGGQEQGIYRLGGKIYLNASYIKAGLLDADLIDVTALFAKDIYMSGKFTSSALTKLPPTAADVDKMYGALIGETMPPADGSYDLDGDGSLTAEDVQLAYAVMRGDATMDSCAGAMEKEATICIDMSNSRKTICISGINQWGSLVESYIGLDYTNSQYVSKDHLATLIRQDGTGSTLYRKVFGSDELEYFNPPMEAGVEYRTIERWLGRPVYTQIVKQTQGSPYSILRRSEAINGFVQLWYVK